MHGSAFANGFSKNRFRPLPYERFKSLSTSFYKEFDTISDLHKSILKFDRDVVPFEWNQAEWLCKSSWNSISKNIL